MVSLHSTYSDGRDGQHGHHHYKYKRRKHKHPVIPDLDLLTRTSWTDAEIGSIQIKKVRNGDKNTFGFNILRH